MTLAHLPALQVVIPLLAAPACLLLRRGALAWGFALAVSLIALAVSAALLQQVLTQGAISYELGGWADPWGIEYRVDSLNAFVLLIVSGIGAVTLAYARESVAAEIASDRIVPFYTCYLLCLTGSLGIVITGDAFNLFVFLEIASLSSYGLIAFGRDRRSLVAAFRYLVLGTIGATFILIGVGLLYAMTGTLNMADLALRLPQVADTRTVTAAFVFLIIGISVKAALFPFHRWLPNAYTFAPSVVSAFLAGTATKVAVYVMLRFLFTIFGSEYVFEILKVGGVLTVLALGAAFAGSGLALVQADLRRMLAYSSVAQIGYMVLGVSFASVSGLIAGIVHLFNHAVIKTALFMVLGCVSYRLGSVALTNVAGLGRRMPWTMGAFVVGGLSLIGVPLTAGFISKWYLVLGALERGWWPVAAAVLVTSLLAAAYVWRVVETAYFRAAPASANGREVKEAPLTLLIPTWLLIATNLYFGIDTRLTVGVARDAAASLLGVTL